MREGKDLFVQLAILIKAINVDEKSIHFFWLGAKADSESELWVKMMARYGTVEDHIHWIGRVDNPSDYLSASDAFCMISREDPMPLIAIEAAMSGLPVICFERAGGTAGWVLDSGGGAVVPYLDIAAMSIKIMSWVQDPKLSRSLGANGRKYSCGKYSVENVAKQILKLINETSSPCQ